MNSLTDDEAQKWNHCPWPEVPYIKGCPCCYLGAVTCVCPLWSNFRMDLDFDLGTVHQDHRAVWELATQEVSYQNNSFLIWIIWTVVLVLNDPNKSVEYLLLYISYSKHSKLVCFFLGLVWFVFVLFCSVLVKALNYSYSLWSPLKFYQLILKISICIDGWNWRSQVWKCRICLQTTQDRRSVDQFGVLNLQPLRQFKQPILTDTLQLKKSSLISLKLSSLNVQWTDFFTRSAYIRIC